MAKSRHLLARLDMLRCHAATFPRAVTGLPTVASVRAHSSRPQANVRQRSIPVAHSSTIDVDLGDRSHMRSCHVLAAPSTPCSTAMRLCQEAKKSLLTWNRDGKFSLDAHSAIRANMHRKRKMCLNVRPPASYSRMFLQGVFTRFPLSPRVVLARRRLCRLR